MLRISTLTLILTLALGSFAQQPEYLQGEVIAQIKDNTDPQDVVDDIKSDYPQLSTLKIDRCLGRYMQVWLFSYENENLDSKEALRAFKQHKQVALAQVNHVVQDRNEPNDPDFDEQWYHIQGGDHDIDTDEAWDITTGGYTAFGDRIVVCIIEGGGADWDHEDLIENHWVNELETPNNGEDDDDNGFVDDYNGWNPPDDDDIIPGGNHGTAVSSMIGARGDNNIGIAGVNWDVGLMQVTVGGLNEANVMEAYEYPLTMRQIYNETGGAEGAFVVATNASWGIDFGDPDDAPLWCAYYDTLGEAGVLNCGATANNNVNIDEVGDLPTACPSDYMVSCTATNNQDVRTFSAYGIEHVDLGAPGESVYLCENGNGYGNTSGTSFASPCVAGVIALMYSVPCPSMMTLVQADPQAGADYILQALYDGVDPIANLADEVATGGRLNANNSCQLLLDQCSETECLIPFSITVEGDGSDDYTVSWGATNAMLSFDVRYRMVGSPDWIEVTDLSDTEYTMADLVWCAEYEVQVLAHCEEEDSSWSTSYVFETIGCCEAPDSMSIEMTDQQEDAITVSWTGILAATSYDIEISEAGAGSWTTISGTMDTEATFDGLDICTEYDVRVRSNCDGDVSEWSDIVTFVTGGCIDCTNLVYCDIIGDGSEEWVAFVQLNTISNTTGSDDGYGDYTNITTDLNGGEEYDIYMEPGYDGFEWSEYFKVWIDYDGNQTFDDTELVFESGTPTNTGVGGSFTVPTGLTPQPVTMRVAMDYNTVNGGGAEPESCGELDFGEAEDYCIILQGDSGIHVSSIRDEQWKLFPNPTSDQVTLVIAQSQLVDRIVITSALGQEVMNFANVQATQQIDLGTLEDGLYFTTIIDRFGNLSSKPILLQR